MGIEQILESGGRRGDIARARLNIRKRSTRPISSYNRGEVISKVTKTGDSGGWNFNPTGRQLPSTPEEVIQANLNAPVVGVGGVVSIPAKYVAPLIGTGLGLGIGALLFGGRGQEQDMTVTPTVTPTQTLDVNPIQELLNKILTNQTNRQDIPIEVGGGSTYRNISGYIASPITQTDTYSEVNNIVYNIQKTFTNASQTTTTTTISEQNQEQGLDLITIALIGGIGLLATGVLK